MSRLGGGGLGNTLDVRDGETELDHEVLGRGGSAESGHTDTMIGEALPAEGGGGLDGHGLLAGKREHRLLVVSGLLVEELPAGHRDDTGINT